MGRPEGAEAPPPLSARSETRGAEGAQRQQAIPLTLTLTLTLPLPLTLTEARGATETAWDALPCDPAAR